MKKIKIAKLLSIIVGLCGIIVILGWIFDIGILKGIMPGWITMKFSTAFCFLLSGITIYLIARSQERSSHIGQIILSITSSIILLIMGTFLASSFLGTKLGLDEAFIRDIQAASVKNWIPGRPSIATMIEFVLIAIAGILAILNLENLKIKLLYLGWSIFLIGGLAFFGYLIRVPLLYYDIKRYTNPMAFHTSILFVLRGISLILLGRRR